MSTSYISRGTAEESSLESSVFTHEVSDEALEAAAGDYLEVRCSQCGGSCTSKCTTSTRRDTREQ